MFSLVQRLLGGTSSNTAASTLQRAAKPIVQLQTSSKQSTSQQQEAPIDGADSAPGAGKLRKAKLIMVTEHNNNKFYEMEEHMDGTFTAHYGRVGSRGTTRNYPIQQWDQKIREKINKGYQDRTHLFSTQKDVSKFLAIKNSAVKNLVEELMRAAQKSIFTNYNVSSDQVTLHQVKEAQAILDELISLVKKRMDLTQFNQKLVDLYSIIPRRMSRVKDHLIERAKSKEDLQAIENKLAEEQATLDVMRGQVELHDKQTIQAETKPQTLLEAFGLQIELIEDDTLIKSIKKMMGGNKKHFHRAFKVINLRSQRDFDTHLNNQTNQTTQLFWHGSRNENWLSILKTGLVLRPANAIINGKMFGYGLYFADKFAKSLNYSSLRGSFWSQGNQHNGFLALYDVHVGKQLKIKKHQPWCYELNTQNLKKQGSQYDSLFAKGGADLINNEYIVYRQEQCTVRYLIEVR